jgi:hypothetical protein
MWEERSVWILRQAGARSDPGVKAGMAVAAPQYVIMGAPTAAVGLQQGYETLLTNPDAVRGFQQGLAGGNAPMDTPQAFIGWIIGKAVRSQIP